MRNQVRSDYNAYCWYWFTMTFCGPGRALIRETIEK